MARIVVPSIYTGAFGHVVEAIEVANNYKTANPETSVSVILCKSPSSTLTRYCPWIDNAFQVDVDGDAHQQIREIPSNWDYVVYPDRLLYSPEQWHSPRLLEVNRQIQKHLIATVGAQSENGKLISGKSLPFQKYSPIKMALPQSTVDWAARQRGRSSHPVISLLLNGSSPFSAFPSLHTWRRLLTKVTNEFPQVEFMLTGVSQTSRFGFTSANFRNRSVRALSRAVPQIKWCMDVGLEKQLAIIADSDIFMAPHTGFSFIAPALGTPWLALSGGTWGDCTVGNTPFHFSVPACDRYPCYGDRKTLCKLKDRLHIPVPCVNGLLEDRYMDIVRGIHQLLDPHFDLKASFDAYRTLTMERSVNTQKLWRIAKYYSDMNIRPES